jgi:hypothetical protein
MSDMIFYPNPFLQELVEESDTALHCTALRCTRLEGYTVGDIEDERG